MRRAGLDQGALALGLGLLCDAELVAVGVAQRHPAERLVAPMPDQSPTRLGQPIDLRVEVVRPLRSTWILFLPGVGSSTFWNAICTGPPDTMTKKPRTGR